MPQTVDTLETRVTTGDAEPLSPRFGRERIAHLASRLYHLDPSLPPLTVRAPATGQLVGQVSQGSPADVRRAVEKARKAQEAWAHRSFEERAEIFVRFHDLLLDRQDEVLDLIQLESGKARKHAFEEVADTAIVAGYYAENAERHLRPKRRKGALPGLTLTWEHHHPRGVVGIISPWNYPLSMAVTDAIPALMAGNAVVLKPDRQTPFTALWAAELLEGAGLPAGLFQVIPGEGSKLGVPLIESCDFLTFTGSTATGKTVGKQAGERLLGHALELGGKNPMLVLAQADVDAAVQGAVRGCFASAGQLCISIERLFVHESLHHAFLDRFVRETQALQLGASFEYDVDLGCLISETQLAKVEEHVQDAVAQGATVATGGRRRPDLGPLFYEPTILTGVTPEMKVFSEETFGPVVAVYPFDSVHDAIERANASRYGLNASVWTRDADLGHRVAARLQCGTVNVNEAYAAAWASVDAPMGGFKDSGLGRRHGAEGILKYTESQTIAIQRGLPLASPAGVPDDVFSRAMSLTLKVLRRVPGLR
ncbi:MAG TPA: succinic semialdehyde dehydrogenase [Thermoanaerobaculia bacterium]|nr:succinic semialdehyde dehydrogenase [Thermoanaerobaculia bacterium]